MSKKRKKKRDLKSVLEELECEIVLYKMRKDYRMVKLVQKKLDILRQQFIEENLKYYESYNTG